jgi:hypothetical protein
VKQPLRLSRNRSKPRSRQNRSGENRFECDA